MVELGLAQSGINKVPLLDVSKLVALNDDVSGEQPVSQICNDRNIGSSDINGPSGRRRWLEICHRLIAKVPVLGVHQAGAQFPELPQQQTLWMIPYPLMRSCHATGLAS